MTNKERRELIDEAYTLSVKAKDLFFDLFMRDDPTILENPTTDQETLDDMRRVVNGFNMLYSKALDKAFPK